MFKNLRAEIIRHGFTMSEFAPKIGLSAQSFSSRVNGKTDFSVREAIAIKKELGSEMTLEELFEEV